MSDRYSQIVNAPVVCDDRQAAGAAAAGQPRPLQGRRPGRRRAGPQRRRPRRPPRARPSPAFLDSIKAERAGTEGKAKALVFDATGIADSTELVELQRFFYPAVGRLQRSGRVVVVGTPPAEAGSARAHTAQRALEGFTRSLAKEIGGRGVDRAAGLRRAGRRGPARLDPALPALAALGLRLRPGRPRRQRRRADARDRLGAPARGQGGAGHRRLARDRRRDRRHPGPRRRQGRRPRHPAGGRRPARGHRRHRRRGARPRHHRRGRAGADRRALRRRRRHRRPQRRRDQRPHDREDAGRALGAADGDQPLQRGADQRRPARRQAAQRQRAHRRRLLDGRDRRQQRPDQLRRLQGRRDRDGRIDGARAGRSAKRRSTPSPPASSRRR